MCQWEFTCTQMLLNTFVDTEHTCVFRHLSRRWLYIVRIDSDAQIHKQWTSMSIGISLCASLSGSPVRPGLIELASGSPSLALLLRSHMATRCDSSHNGTLSATLSLCPPLSFSSSIFFHQSVSQSLFSLINWLLFLCGHCSLSLPLPAVKEVIGFWMGCFVLTIDRNRRGGEHIERGREKEGWRGRRRGRGRVPREDFSAPSGIFMTCFCSPRIQCRGAMKCTLHLCHLSVHDCPLLDIAHGWMTVFLYCSSCDKINYPCGCSLSLSLLSSGLRFELNLFWTVFDFKRHSVHTAKVTNDCNVKYYSVGHANNYFNWPFAKPRPLSYCCDVCQAFRS